MKIFALNSSRSFGELVAKEIGVPLSMHEEIEFEDGEHKSRSLENVRGEDVFVIQSLYADLHQSVEEKLCRLLFFIGALKDASVRSVTAVLPYLCYARKDQKSESRDPVITRYIASLFEVAGTDHLITIDVHDVPAFQNAFRIPTDHLEGKSLFTEYIQRNITSREIVVLSPDIGGIKRAENFQKSLQKRLQKEVGIAFMEKYRKAGVVSGGTIIGAVEGKTVLIIDDMISTGTTIAKAVAACEKEKATSIWVFVTHGLFTGKAVETLDFPILKGIIITNTIPRFRIENTSLHQKVISLNVAPLFASAIQRMHEGGSVSALLQD